MDISFERCKRDDMKIFALWLLSDSVGKHIFIEDTEKYYLQSEQNDDYRMYSVFCDGRMIAHLSGERYGDEVSLCLVVCPEIHNMGVGAAVLRTVKADSHRLFGKAARLSAYICNDNPGSRRCFEKAGFVYYSKSEDDKVNKYIYDIGRNNMNEVISKMAERRSVRSYTDVIPSDEAINEIIMAGTYAASGMNRQETIIVAIKNKEIRDELARDNAAVMGGTNDPFYGAPVVLVVLYNKDCPTGIYDGSLVMGNLMLAAHSLGVSSCWIHRAKETFEMPKWKNWLKTLGFEGEYIGVGNCILGYCDGDYPQDREEKITDTLLLNKYRTNHRWSNDHRWFYHSLFAKISHTAKAMWEIKYYLSERTEISNINSEHRISITYPRKQVHMQRPWSRSCRLC